jgi:hypothetical protein
MSLYRHKMDMQQILGLLLAKIDNVEANMKSNQEQIQTNRQIDQEKAAADRKTSREYIKEMMNEMKNEIKVVIRGETKHMRDKRTEAHLECQKPTSGDMKICQEKTTCHEAMEGDTKEIELNPGMMQSVAEHQEAPKEDAIVKPVEGRKKRHRGRKQAAGRHGELVTLPRSTVA